MDIQLTSLFNRISYVFVTVSKTVPSRRDRENPVTSFLGSRKVVSRIEFELFTEKLTYSRIRITANVVLSCTMMLKIFLFVTENLCLIYSDCTIASLINGANLTNQGKITC